MISLFYRLRLLNYILSGFKDVVVKLSLFTIYLYVSSIILMLLSNGFQYAIEFSSPKHALYYIYQYFKWCYDNQDNLGYGVTIRILVALFTPHFLYKLFLRIKWQPALKNMIIKILRSLRRKNSHINEEFNESTYNNRESANIYREGTNKTHIESVNTIKRLLMQDIEQTIDKRLHDIFLSRRDKSH